MIVMWYRVLFLCKQALDNGVVESLISRVRRRGKKRLARRYLYVDISVGRD